MELKQESVIPRIFELTRFLVTSMTFLVNVERVAVFLDNIELSRVIKSRKLNQSITIPKHMVTKSRDGTMSIDSVKLISQEVEVIFPENIVGAPKKPIVRADLEESERNPTKSRTFFSTKTEEEVTSKPNGKAVAPRYPGVTSRASLKGGAEFSAKCSIYSANVSVSAKRDLEAGLKSATKKKPPKSFSFEMVFFGVHSLIRRNMTSRTEKKTIIQASEVSSVGLKDFVLDYEENIRLEFSSLVTTGRVI
ncbi:hypothetical protein AZE42_03361 [Rhizopogon vesiculosus]|uniref:Uncharacterized protein n=1 Tax=Rhizopogon vesiculosus TaxID=180088 RepID=A0A1J8QGN9_9AGAM|nr:hypothetical protein AZE42_03361 [Rhizopogon vesiculosus]